MKSSVSAPSWAVSGRSCCGARAAHRSVPSGNVANVRAVRTMLQAVMDSLKR
jgi:hypothetical protein